MKFFAAAIIGAMAFALVTQPNAAQASDAHVHIGHIMDLWQDTPDHKGLLTTAEREAEVAHRHAGFATAKADDIGSIKMHIKHVLHAVDPGDGSKGPGNGFGVLRASAAIIAHSDLAAQSGDASPNVKAHAAHVQASADNVVAWSRQIVKIGARIDQAEDAATAFALASEVLDLAGHILEGVDADEDGNVSWGPNEGGLKQTRQHMTLMKRGEGLM